MNTASVETKGKKVMGKVLGSMGTIFFLFVSALAGCRFPPATVPNVSPDGGASDAAETGDGGDAGDAEEECLEWACGTVDGSLYCFPVTCDQAREIEELNRLQEEEELLRKGARSI